jgi:galactokinase
VNDTAVRDRARRAFAARFGDRATAREWWVPGRIELLGKHVDYGGGRSLLTAVERGIHVIARPRDDNLVHLTDARSRLSFSAALDIALPAAPGRWTNYPISVIRRLTHDFGVTRGVDMVLASSLPSAAGLSSSSAVIIATFLPLAHVNHLRDHPLWQRHLGSSDALPGYLGALENGLAFGPFPADFGVGTLGGSQDHTAIMAARTGRVARFRFLPVANEGEVAMPDDWCFVVAASGVSAPKAGAVKARYNELSLDMAEIIDCWNHHESSPVISLLAALDSSDDALERLARRVAALPNGTRLERRLRQFDEETRQIVPAVFAALAAGDAATVGSAIDRSQHLAETVLGNQIPETIFLARRARDLGALAASAFGAGFGGSVYAIVTRRSAEGFTARWEADYRNRFPAAAKQAVFFVSGAGMGAGALPPE